MDFSCRCHQIVSQCQILYAIFYKENIFSFPSNLAAEVSVFLRTDKFTCYVTAVNCSRLDMQMISFNTVSCPLTMVIDFQHSPGGYKASLTCSPCYGLYSCWSLHNKLYKLLCLNSTNEFKVKEIIHDTIMKLFDGVIKLFHYYA